MGKKKDSKENIYKDVIMRSTATLWQRMSDLMDTVPDETNYDDLTPEQKEVLEIVDAIEREWIIDDEAREQVSLINWEDCSDDDET